MAAVTGSAPAKEPVRSFTQATNTGPASPAALHAGADGRQRGDGVAPPVVPGAARQVGQGEHPEGERHDEEGGQEARHQRQLHQYLPHTGYHAATRVRLRRGDRRA
jgi:hypothetical protein